MWAQIRGYPLTAFGLCLIAYATAQMDLALFGFAIPAIRAEFGLSLTGVMWIVSSAFVLGGILIVWLAVLADRMSRKGLFEFSLIGSSILVTLHSFVPNPATLALLRGTSIGVGGLSYPVSGAIVSEEFPARYRGLFLGLIQIGYPLGWALASVWAAWLLTEYDWRRLFLVGLVSLPLVLIVRRVIREPARAVSARTADQPRARVRDLLAPGIRQRALLLFAAQFLFVWAYAGSIFLFPSYLSDARGLESVDFSRLIGAGNAIGILGYVLAAVTGEFWLTRRTTLIVWTLLGAAMFQVLVWMTHSLRRNPRRLRRDEHVFLWHGSREVRLSRRGVPDPRARNGHGNLRLTGGDARFGRRPPHGVGRGRTSRLGPRLRRARRGTADAGRCVVCLPDAGTLGARGRGSRSAAGRTRMTIARRSESCTDLS